VPESPRAEATSTLTSDPANRPQAAVDGVLATSWLAASGDTRPELSLSWGDPRRVRGVRLVLTPDLVARRPRRMTVTVNGRETTDIVSARGTLTVPAQEATSLKLRFDNADVVRSVDPTTGVPTVLPVGVNEVRILGAEDIVKGPGLTENVIVPCGLGPDLVIDGVSAAGTAITATARQVLTDDLVSATLCGGRVVSLDSGTHVIEAQSTREFIVEAVALEPVDSEAATGIAAGALDEVDVVQWGPTERTVSIAAADDTRLLETTENFNDGWQAVIKDLPLTPVRVDGWRQAWIVPAGAGGVVSLAFGPQPWYLGGLVAGALAALALVGLALRGRRLASSAEAHEAPPEPQGYASVRAWVLAGCALAVGAVLGGWAGVAACVIGVGLGIALPRSVVACLLAAGAAMAAAAMPWPARLDASAVLTGASALLALAAVASTAAPGRSRSGDGPSPGSAAPEGTTTH
jgi:arabinofuranan 3-O-arabinosyltransferase